MLKWWQNNVAVRRRREADLLTRESARNEGTNLAINRIANALEATGTQEQADDDARARREKLTIALLFFTVFFTGLGDLIFYFTMTDAHDNAARQITSSDAALKVDQRAWLGIATVTPKPSQPAVGGIFNVELDLKNTGKTPAKNIDIISVGQTLVKAKAIDFGYDKFKHIKNGFVPPDGLAPMMLSPVVDQQGVPFVLTQDMLNLIANGDWYVVVHGQVDYDDIFGRRHWLTYCSKLMAPLNGTFGQCDTHNDTGDY